MSEQQNIIIAGGGTGGHLYPALAVARALQSHLPSIQPHFVGSSRGLETRIVPREGFPLHLLGMSGGLAKAGWTQKLKTLLSLPWAVFQSVKLILLLRPRFVLGVGGYASAPAVLAAFLLRKPTYIWEANAFPGMANRWLSRFTDISFVSFEEAAELLKSHRVVKCGHPVRAAMSYQPRAASEKLRVLIFGGSQGARGINSTVSGAVTQAMKNQTSGRWLERVEIIHQTGKQDFENTKRAYPSGSPVQIFEYLNDIQDQYAWADVVFCRAGASTIAELGTCQKASVLIPFPFATDNHQQKNAQALVDIGAAILVSQNEFTPACFQSLIENFLSDPRVIQSLEKNIKKFDSHGSAEKLAAQLIKESMRETEK